jgi:hypothetical protein
MSLLSELRQAVRNLAISPPSQNSNNPGPVTYGGAPTANVIPGEIDEQVTISLDGSGNGTASITPPGSRSAPVWTVSNVFVSVATNTNEATATLYVSRGIKTATAFDARGQTATGSSGDQYSVGFTLRPGDWLSVSWNGGDAGAKATMTIKGTFGS